MAASAPQAQATVSASPQSSSVTPSRSRPRQAPSSPAHRTERIFSSPSVMARPASSLAAARISSVVTAMAQPPSFRTLAASWKIFAKPEMEVMAARSSWRSMSLSYSTSTSLARTSSSA